MKMRSRADTLDAYEAHLRGAIPRADGEGTSRLISVRRRRIGGLDWIEGRRDGSEVPGWETTYLAGNTADVGILITFSVHPRFRDARVPDLERMLETIVVNQSGL
jgi:hypothetical protein